ncbi:hypothetical protein N0V88_002557 [Collariella sp. IMI 366227]|nr:hypothetical protein N0V88_002557 [Collariella sp. IMI 366227]
MAFQQSTRHFAQRADARRIKGRHISDPQSQTWVLFTPGTEAETSTSYLGSVQDDQTTPGRSRASDLGSLGTIAPSEINLQVPSEVPTESIAEEDAELDSLDSHLPEFRTTPSPYNQPEVAHAAPVFPGHDGLGSFRFETPEISTEAQDRLYAFEQFNPHRVRQGAEYFDLAHLEVDDEEAQESERTRRIEAWRLEQSQLLLEDIQKETRRRRQSEASLRKAQEGTSQAQEVPERGVADDEAADINLTATEWHDQDAPSSNESRPGWLSRIARKVIRELMGIDDKMLAVLFGEVVPDDGMLSSGPQASDPSSGRIESESSHDSEWQLRMLDRIARELGVLVHQMSTQHPGAFSTYTRVQHMALPYAGLPVIPETPADLSESGQKMDDSVSAMPQFKPTVGQRADLDGARASEPTTPLSAPSTAEMTPHDPRSFTQQEWEQDLDIRLVFRYLRSRFTSSRPTSPPFSSGASHLATSSAADIAAKAARVRQHHPLVSHAHTHGHTHTHGYHHHHRARPVERRTFKATVPSSSPVVAIRHHAPGSCASQSTRRSARRSSISSRPSSRHYWDIGGSIGTGSVIASTGPMGSWGEV